MIGQLDNKSIWPTFICLIHILPIFYLFSWIHLEHRISSLAEIETTNTDIESTKDEIQAIVRFVRLQMEY